MPSIYTHLTTQKRAVVTTMRDDQNSIRSIAGRLIVRPTRSAMNYAGHLHRLPIMPILLISRVMSGALHRSVHPSLTSMVRCSKSYGIIRSYSSRRSKLRTYIQAMSPDDSEKTVVYETIYEAIYLHPRDELKRELTGCFRHHTQVRKARSRGSDRRSQIKDMQSIYICPPELEDCLISGH